MKARIGFSLVLLFALTTITVGSGQAQGPQPQMILGTPFTYQGQLRQGGLPVNGTCDFQFSLWDLASGGAQIGSTLTHTGVAVTRGLFTALLDVGASPFQGADRYLQVAVRCPAGSGSYTTLTPRQALTPTPYALYAAAAPWGGLIGIPAGFADGTDNDTLYTAGAGLSLSSNQFSVNFAGTGAASTAARSDHQHDAAYVNEGQSDSVTSAMIVNGAVESGDLRDGATLAEILDDDGAGSGLDADLLDGQHASAFAGSLHNHDASAITTGTLSTDRYSAYSDLTAEGYLDASAGTDLLTLAQGNSRYWSLTGNAGTNPAANFLGTTDNQALELRVNNARALRLEPNAASPNVVGGHSSNAVTAGVAGATISGGGYASSSNRVTDDYGTVGGGSLNQAGDNAGATNDAVYATVGGGGANTAGKWGATVGGGQSNDATGYMSTIAGGFDNNATGQSASVGGGEANTASGTSSTVAGGYRNVASSQGAAVGGGEGNQAAHNYATVPGGQGNFAGARYTLAAGRRAQANHPGAFVWADETNADFASTANNQFAVRAGGGVVFTSTVSAMLRMYPHSTAPNIIGGYEGNAFSAGVAGATIAGGGINTGFNRVTDQHGTIGGGAGNRAGNDAGTTIDAAYATISGGWQNTASGSYSSIGGGWDNVASYPFATVGGGYENQATGERSTIAGGRGNNATAYSATIGGGQGNDATATRATIAGGDNNTAGGTYSAVGGGQDNTASAAHAAIGGGQTNIASGGHAAIGGGATNEATASFSTVAGGSNNDADGLYSTVGGGLTNEATGNYGTIAGGYQNTATDLYAAVGGGYSNDATNNYATIAGGLTNAVSGMYATVPGGRDNLAAANYSFAAGNRAKANFIGCFVWGDSTDADVACNVNNRWVARASGGVYFYTDAALTTGVRVSAGGGAWASVSDRRLKENFARVEGVEVLKQLSQVPITTWNYKSQDATIRHIGPVAQDFYAAFGVGEDDLSITTIDADGVALAALQGAYQLLQEKDAQIAAQQQQIDDLQARMAALEAMVAQLAQSQKGGSQ